MSLDRSKTQAIRSIGQIKKYINRHRPVRLA